MGKYTKTSLSIADKIYREKIRADYPPSLPHTLPPLTDTGDRAEVDFQLEPTATR